MLRKILSKITIPHRHCYLCQQYSDSIICSVCSHGLTFEQSFVTQGNFKQYNQLYRANILDGLVTPNYHALLTLGTYEWPLSNAIRDLKFANKTYCGEVLTQWFYQQVLQAMWAQGSNIHNRPQALIAVPLSRRRHNSRHYNQAQLLADRLSKLSGIPCIYSLKRNKHTQAQSGLRRIERLQNLQDAFVCVEHFPYQHVALIDDVITTGATIKHACDALLEHHPNLIVSVWVMAIAKA